jgi:hypothetical protein
LSRSWRDLVAEVVDQLPTQFTLQDVLRHKEHHAGGTLWESVKDVVETLGVTANLKRP